MEFKELEKQIKKELVVDKNHLDFCASENPILIQKYITMYLYESRKINEKQIELDILYKDKMLYYKLEHQYVPETQKELSVMLEGDKDICEIKKYLNNQALIIKFLSDTVANFRDRGWAMKNMIEFKKFMAGE
jgi:hypothetical protein